MADFAEVDEKSAEGKIKAVFDDVKATLGIATVGPLFRQLATYPWYLQLAWRNLKPNASIAYFHRTAGEIESLAIASAGGRKHRASGAEAGEFGQTLDALLDLDSKLLMATAALRNGANGQAPKMNWISSADKQTVSPSPTANFDGGPEDSTNIQADDFDLVSGQPQLRVLLRWPDDFRRAAAAAAKQMREAGFEQRMGKLQQAAALAAESLPYRMEISSSVCRQAGLTEDEIDAVRAVINSGWESIPRSLLTSAAMTAAPSRSSQAEPVAAA